MHFHKIQEQHELYPFSLLLISVITEILAGAIRQDKEKYSKNATLKYSYL